MLVGHACFSIFQLSWITAVQIFIALFDEQYESKWTLSALSSLCHWQFHRTETSLFRCTFLSLSEKVPNTRFLIKLLLVKWLVLTNFFVAVLIVFLWVPRRTGTALSMSSFYLLFGTRIHTLESFGKVYYEFRKLFKVSFLLLVRKGQIRIELSTQQIKMNGWDSMCDIKFFVFQKWSTCISFVIEVGIGGQKYCTLDMSFFLFSFILASLLSALSALSY